MYRRFLKLRMPFHFLVATRLPHISNSFQHFLSLIKLNMRKNSFLLLLVVSLILSWNASAQLVGTKNIPGDYGSIIEAVDSLNSQGVGTGGVVFNIAAGFVDSLPGRKIVMTATGTAANPIVFQKSGAGANPVIKAYSGGSGSLSSQGDGFWVLAGSDYVTIDGVDLQESASNTTSLSSMEFGYALFKASAIDGAQYNVIRNCTITMNNIQAQSWVAPGYYGSNGILMLNSLYTASGSVTVTAATGSNSYNSFQSNTIRNAFAGIVLYGYNDIVSPYSFGDTGNDVGGNTAVSGNSITNFGAVATTSTTTGIYLYSQAGFNCRNNTVVNNTGTGVNHTGTLSGIHCAGTLPSSGGVISTNSITLSSGGTTGTCTGIQYSASSNSARTVTICNNVIRASYPTSTSGGTYGIYSLTAGTGTFTVCNNTLRLSTNATSGSMYGIFNTAPVATNFEITGNTIDSLVVTNGTSGAVRGIYVTAGAATCSTVVSSNSISGLSYSGATAGGEFAGISFAGSFTGLSLSISNNTISAPAIKSTGTIYGIYASYPAPANGSKTIQNNSILSLVRTTTSGTASMYGYYDNSTSPSTTSHTISGNIISGLNNGVSTGTLTGIYSQDFNGSNPVLNVTGNTVTGLSAARSATGINVSGFAGSSAVPNAVSNNTIGPIAAGLGTLTSAAVSVTGLQVGAQGLYVDVRNNIVDSVSSNLAATINGIYFTGVTNQLNVYRNKVYALSGNDDTTALYGMTIAGGALVNAYNNIIGINGLSSFVANGTNNVIGLNITGGTTVNAYYNSIYLDANSTASLSGSSGIFTTATPLLSLRNNLVVNKCSASGSSGKTVAFRRSTGTAGSPPSTSKYDASSNNNLFYAGVPDTVRLIYMDTLANKMSTLADYKSFMTGRDQASQTGDVSAFLASVNAGSPDFLHISPGSNTVLESGASPITGITTDYDGDTRSASSPDIGADEFTGVTPAPVLTGLTVSPSAPQCISIPHTVTVDASDPTGTITGVVLSYSFDGVAQSPINMTNTSGSIWTGIIPVATPTNAVVTWSVLATGSSSLQSGLTGTAYQDDPLNGAVTTISANPASLCPGSSVTLTASLYQAGTVSIGTGANSNSGNPNPLYGATGFNAHNQYLIRAAELVAAGVLPGPINSLGLTVLSGTNTIRDVSIKLSNNVATTASSYITGTWATVYSAAAYTPVTGLSIFPFSVPFIWDGTSNLAIEICHGYTGGSGTLSSTIATDNTSFVSNWHYNSTTGATGTTVCGVSTGGSTNSIRPKFTFTANLRSSIASISWKANGAVVDTVNPSSQYPSDTTTYIATITGSSGCTLVDSVTVDVYPSIPVPVTTNASQCGSGVPTCSVSSTSGSTAPIFRWYAGPLGGTPLQSDTSSTYRTSIAATTTFYVSEFNGTCESSPRVLVTQTVSSAPVLTLSPNTTVCTGTAVQLTASTTSDPNNRYSWMPGNLQGSSVSVAPVTTTTYTVTSLDTTTGPTGGCVSTGTTTVTLKPVPASVTVSPAAGTICSASPVVLTASGGTLAVTGIIGTGAVLNDTSGTNAYPTPFGNLYRSARQQYLILAAELSAAGLSAGNITSIAFDIDRPKTTPLSSYTLSMGHTALNAFATSFVTTGMTTVFSSPSFTPSGTPGYAANTIQLTTPFYWNGTGNVIVEICFNNTSSSSNATCRQSLTAGATTIYYRSNTNPTCAATAFTNVLAQRPNMRFNVQVLPAWSWAPDTSSVNTIAVHPSVTTTYTATATINGCASSAAAGVTVPNNPYLAVACSSTNISCNGQRNGTAGVAPTGGNGSYSYSWSNGATAGSLIGLAAGNYVATVTDGNGCSVTCTASVNEPSPLAVTLSPRSRTVCGYAATDTIRVSASGGTAPYNGTGVFLQGVGTTTYSVTDANGCVVADSASIQSLTYPVTVNVNGPGTAIPSQQPPFGCGDTVTYSFAPSDACSDLITVIIDGVNLGPIASYSFNAISSIHTVNASFTPLVYTVTASTGANGTVSGPQRPACGSYPVYSITPDPCYRIDSLIVDGVLVAPTNLVTFPSINSNHSIYATFSRPVFTVTTTATGAGTVTPTGAFNYDCGDTVAIHFLPDSGKVIDSIVVDGLRIPADTMLVFTGIDSDHTVHAYFSGCAVPAVAVTPLVWQLCTFQHTYSLQGSFGGGASSATWSSNGTGTFDNTTVGVGTVYNVTPADTLVGSVTITMTTNDPDGPGDCQAATSSTTISISAQLTITITGNTSICPGDSTVLTASGAPGYLWFNNATTASVTVSAPGFYYVDGYATGGCGGTGYTTVVMNSLPAPPQFIIGPDTLINGTSFCDGNAVSLSSSYLFGNTWNTGDTVNTILVSSAGNYSVTYTDANGCSATSLPFQITVNPLPSVSIVGLDTLICTYAAPIALNGSPSGGDFSGAPVFNNLLNPSITGAGSFLISYQYTDANGCTGYTDQQVLIDECLGVMVQEQPTLNVYPNPATAYFIVEYSGSGITIRIENAVGQLIREVRPENGKWVISREELTGPGIYLIRLLDDAGTTRQVKRVVVE